ncbi:MAG: ATP-dependent DNA helicase RecG [Terriglobales bacterium]
MPDSAPALHPALGLRTGVQFVPGVGPKLAQVLQARGIVCVEDLISTLPFRYEDRSQRQSVQELREGEAAVVVAQVQSLGFRRARNGMTTLDMLVSDGTGMLRCGWFHADHLRERLQTGQMLALYGKLVREQGRLLLRQPEYEILDGARGAELHSLKLGRIVPVYEAMGTLASGSIRRLVHAALARLPRVLPDPLPQPVRNALALPGRREALEQTHFPSPGTPLEDLQQARTPGQRRLILEELFFLQAGLELKRRRLQRQAGAPMAINAAVRERLKQVLPFHPTAGQKQVLAEIAADLCSGRPMRRLLQGEVGSGKTIVALQAAVIAMENGFQVALMAPTQILAEQHYLYARERLPHHGTQLVTGGRKRRTSSGETPQLVIGTQALLEGSFRFERLGLVIVDEQHRFGVLQRFHLMHKDREDGWAAHLLVMTATPIPRSLALTLYGDLDASTLRELPPGARPIVTRIVPDAHSDAVYEFVRRQVEAGRQAYFVYPLIEESEALALKPALAMFERLRRMFPQLRLGLLHGRLPAEEKQAVMLAFRRGELQALVATSVIEVGVDVPNASLMVIEHADRFGIAQLHQLRGRVGRPQPAGSRPQPAYCFLLHPEGCTAAAGQRLRALARTRDGFALAELDLKLRGPGEFFGTRQSGLPAFQIAQPVRDRELMEAARTQAQHYLDRASPEEQRELVAEIQQRWQRRYGLVEVG